MNNKTVNSLIIDIGILFVIVAGMIFEVKWALNISLVALWVMSAITILSIMFSELDYSDVAYSSGTGLFIDSIYFCVIAGSGYISLSVLYLIAALSMYSYKLSCEDKIKNSNV